MKKRGQITSFIILGMCMVIALLIILYVVSDRTQEKLVTESRRVEDVSSFASPVEAFVESCLQETGVAALTFVGRHGGYYLLPEQVHPQFSLPYYWHHNRSYLISRQELEHQIAQYVNNELFFCLRNFAALHEKGYALSLGEVTTTAHLMNAELFLKLHFPISIRQNNATQTLSEFSTTIPSRLASLHEMIAAFIELQLKDASSLCILCIVRLSLEYDVRVQMNSIEPGVILFTIIDEHGLDNSLYQYKFAHSYGAKEP